MAFASKSLSDKEYRYANNEFKLLAVLTGLKRFHYYAYGRTIHVITDHTNIFNIIQKDLAEMHARMQRIACQMHQYDVALHYRKGKYMLCKIVYHEILSMRKTWVVTLRIWRPGLM